MRHCSEPADPWPLAVPGLWLTGLCLVGLGLSGCSKAPPPVPVPVKGKVVGVPSKALQNATVTFWPQGSLVTKSKTALCKGDGTFSLECPKGTYKVTVSPPKPLGQAAVPKAQTPASPIPNKCQSQVSTPLRVDVPDNGRDDVVLDLKAHK